MRVRAITANAVWTGLLALAVAGALPDPAGAQMQTREGIALQNQILELQRQIQVLTQRGGAGGYPNYPQSAYPPPPASSLGASNEIVTRLLTRVETLEGSVRELRGRVEELGNRLQQQTAQLNKRIEDLQFQVQNPPGGGSGPPPAVSSAPPAPPPAAAPAALGSAPPRPATGGRRTPEALVQEGQDALQRGDYRSAEQDAREVLANRASAGSYDAQFLLAQALLGQKQYSQAAIAYDDAYNRQKKGSHAQDSLLGLADALVAINEKRAACDTLSKLRAEFPTRGADVQDRAAQIARRANCR
jgi:TolA-binding protein